MQTTSFAMSGEKLLQTMVEIYFSSGVICRTTNRTIPPLSVPLCLFLIQFIIIPLFLHQFFMGPLFRNLSFLQNDNPAGDPGRAKAVCHQNPHFIPDHLLEFMIQYPLFDGIDR